MRILGWFFVIAGTVIAARFVLLLIYFAEMADEAKHDTYVAMAIGICVAAVGAVLVLWANNRSQAKQRVISLCNHPTEGMRCK